MYCLVPDHAKCVRGHTSYFLCFGHYMLFDFSNNKEGKQGYGPPDAKRYRSL